MAAARERFWGPRDEAPVPSTKAQVAGWATLGVAALLPAILWHRTIALIASDFRLDLHYLVTGWTAYFLIVAGLLFAIPVMLSIGRRPSSRWYPRRRGAYAGWAVVLYLMGVILATEVAQIAAGVADA